MAKNRLNLFNQAVSAAGGQARITDPDENSREANLCRLWYESVRDNVLQTGPWPSTKVSTLLALIATRDTSVDWTDGDPGPGWRYAYAEPTDLLRPRYIHTYQRFERQSLSDKTRIMTNVEKAILTYTRISTDIAKWDNELYLAVVFSLSAHVTLTLNGKQSLLDRLQQRAQAQILLASTDLANEQHFRDEGQPSLLSVRDYQAPPIRPEFSFPYATLNVVPA